jgi:hypothetical protein
VRARSAGQVIGPTPAQLRHLERAGFAGSPRVVGDRYDDQGREVLTYRRTHRATRRGGRYRLVERANCTTTNVAERQALPPAAARAAGPGLAEPLSSLDDQAPDPAGKRHRRLSRRRAAARLKRRAGSEFAFPVLACAWSAEAVIPPDHCDVRGRRSLDRIGPSPTVAAAATPPVHQARTPTAQY